MTIKTSGDIEKELIDGLKDKTDYNLKGWLAEIDAFGSKKRNDIINWLKEEKGFGHMNASLLLGIYQNAGQPVYANTGKLLENQFIKADAMLPLYQSFVEFIGKNFPNATILPKKTYVSILEKREFAAINIKPKELRVGLDLGQEFFDESISKSKLTGPMPRISHMLILTAKDQLNSNFVRIIRESYSRSH